MCHYSHVFTLCKPEARAGLSSYLTASYAFIERNFNIVKRYWTWEIVWLVYTVANSLAVSYIGLGFEAMGGAGINGRYFVLYLTVGTIVWRYLAVIFYWVTDLVGLERWDFIYTGILREEWERIVQGKT